MESIAIDFSTNKVDSAAYQEALGQVAQSPLEQFEIELSANPTPSDLRFMHSDPCSFPASNLSTLSDAESAPPEFENLFSQISTKCEELLRNRNAELPPEWSIPELIRTLIGNEALQIPGYLQDIYYDVMLRGENSWLFSDLESFIDLINYAL